MTIDFTAFWKFAETSPLYAFLIVLAVAYAATRPFKYAMLAYARRVRAKNIALYGWPTPPVDADGDIVYPDREDD